MDHNPDCKQSWYDIFAVSPTPTFECEVRKHIIVKLYVPQCETACWCTGSKLLDYIQGQWSD